MADGANPSDSDDGPSPRVTAIIAIVCLLILVIIGVAYFGDGTYGVPPKYFNSRFGTVILDSEGLSFIRAPKKLSWEGRDQIISYIERLREVSSQTRALSVTRSRLEHLFILSVTDGWTEFQFVIDPVKNPCSEEAIRNRFTGLTLSPTMDRPLPGSPGVRILEYRVTLSVDETVDLIEALIEDDCGNIEKDELTLYYAVL